MAVTSTQEKVKKLCFERRAACIIKKAIELQILCDLKIGVVILSPDGKLETWPPELKDAKAILDAGKEMPRVKSEKRKGDNPESSHREILDSKLQLLNQRVEFLKGKEIATTSQGGETLVRSKKRKDFCEEGYPEILNSKLQLLKKREMMFLNPSANSPPSASASTSAEGKEIDLFDDLGGECDDFFLNLEEEEEEEDKNPQNNGGNAATFKGKEIDLFDHLGGECDDFFLNFEEEEEEDKDPHQNSFTALGNGLLPTPTAAEECGEVQVRKKARLQYPTAPLNNNLPQFTHHPAADYWEALFTDAGWVNSTDAMLSLLQDL